MDFTPLPERPVVLVFAGHDPGGGAGVQADIEAIGSLGCHAATLLTALTVQDTRDVRRYAPVPVELLLEQAGLLLADYRIAAVKVGMTGAPETVAAIATVLDRLPGVPVVVDPVLAAGGGTSLGGDALRTALRRHLLPRATLATPNSPEALALAPEADTPAACAQELLAGGCAHVLVTGGHDAGPEVVSTLYGNHRMIARHAWPRLPGEFHGSGCTLASACAALLAQGADIASAVDEALAYTWHALGNARRPGQGQAVPDRFFWAQGKRWQRSN
jgi:hydroxymethylpyrimidine/phosphomethylpyrimidine kinase